MNRISILKVQSKLPAVPSTELFLNRYAEITAYLFSFSVSVPKLQEKKEKKKQKII